MFQSVVVVTIFMFKMSLWFDVHLTLKHVSNVKIVKQVLRSLTSIPVPPILLSLFSIANHLKMILVYPSNAFFLLKEKNHQSMLIFVVLSPPPFFFTKRIALRGIALCGS